LQKIHLFWPSITVKGALEFIFPTHQIEFCKHSKERNSAINLQLIHDGRIIIEPFYTHQLKPEQCAEAYQGLREKKDEYIGVVFDWTK
jgi:threonine dehydrogenase-like Zn-dependent dehydrogenase